MSKLDPEPFSNWKRCPDDAIADLVRDNVDHRRRKFLASFGAGTIFAAAGITLFTTFAIDEFQAGDSNDLSIGCRDVNRLYPKFIAKQLGELDMSRIRNHLKLCSSCYGRYTKPDCRPPRQCFG